jgi:glucosyl-3-phosphoglycerate synthase
MLIGKEMSNAKNVTVIFPAKNEANTIENAIKVVKQSQYNPEVIVVDAFSTDKTFEIAQKAGAMIIQPEVQMHPGKGLAMKTGLMKALGRSADVILFLDADIRNLTHEWVDKLVRVVLDGRCDMSRGFYLRHPRDGAVTKLVARPMPAVFFPELAHFEQPLSGEVCARKEVWDSLMKRNPPDGWGIDVWFLIECAMLGYNILEMFLGSKDHASFADYEEDVTKLSKMAEQVGFTIIREAMKYDRSSWQTKVNV